jgi:predicted Fe-Mo cluster-binding NifX family protein
VAKGGSVKIAFATTGRGLDGPMDDRFGRAQSFLVYDLDAGAFEVVDNGLRVNAAQGAGILSAEAVARTGAGGLVARHCGPKAFRVLRAAGVKVYFSQAATVAQALEEYRSGGLAEVQSADVEGHWA